MTNKNQPIDPLADYRLTDAPGHLLRRCQQRAVELFNQEVGGAGPTPRQFAAMLTIYQNPGLNQTELVRRTGIDRSTIGDLVGRLVQRGWVERQRTDDDARANALSVTPDGVESLRRAVDAIDRTQARILDPLPEDQHPVLLNFLRRLADLPDDV